MTLDERIIAILKTHKGHRNAISVLKLCEMLGENGEQINERELRFRISELVKHERATIGSCNAGFYWIETEEDLAIAVHYLSECLKPLAERMSALKFNYTIATTTQGELFNEVPK